MNCGKCDVDISFLSKRCKYCEGCSKLAIKESYKKYRNKKDIKSKKKEYAKEHYLVNKDRLKPIRKKWRDDNKEKEKEYNRTRYEDVDKERLSNYYKDNKEEINKKKKEYRKTEEGKKWLNEYKIKNAHKQRYRDSLKSVIRRLNRNKNDYTNNLLGYSDLEFKLYIEMQFIGDMSWENRKSFEIDHIIPIVAFVDNTPLKIVSALDNLRPMYPFENIKKYTSIDYDCVDVYEKYIDYLTDDYKIKILDYKSNLNSLPTELE
jgi:hypothetical protein